MRILMEIMRMGRYSRVTLGDRENISIFSLSCEHLRESRDFSHGVFRRNAQPHIFNMR